VAAAHQAPTIHLLMPFDANSIVMLWQWQKA